MAITTGKAILKESRVIGSVAGFTHATEGGLFTSTRAQMLFSGVNDD
jgi:hypothetical protein